ncbi:hypothetical protein KGMB01110_09310 [Mediterraneibacter butyricigenes]|uniref:O-antigen ligase-related domain-containing protein n=1 Tax=Mediterraneibacter butyricigenes TaxID=2316025 RepID=A0A391NZK6_9FIRM|nr:O-antigen ligase family protein [Mediterraneibacter butyricigenes]GCA66495.1 hypothetical protein KGMB01110_09310 [Mediterraneibacter butyricigenes]
MKNISLNIRKLISILGAYGIAFSLFISTGGAWTNTSNIELAFSDVIWRMLIIVISTSIILFLLNNSHRELATSSQKRNIIFLGLCCLTYAYQFQGDFYEYFSWFCLPVIWFIFFLMLCDDINIVWKAFINVAVIFAIISLFYFVFGTCLNIVSESEKTAIYWGTWDSSAIRTFHNLYYEAQFLKINATQFIARNCGIFCEAPMYNFVLCIAVSAELFIMDKVHWWKILILLATIITTFSTTGYLFIVITVLLYLANIIFTKKGGSIHKIAFSILTILGMMIVLGILIHKITTISGAGSVNVRSDHLKACIKAWLDSPILGVGYENQSVIMEYEKYKQGISVGFPYLLATGGMLLSSLLIVPYVKLFKNSFKTKRFEICIFETLFLILYFFTAITFFPILRFYIAYIFVLEFDNLEINNKTDSVKNFITNKLEEFDISAQMFKSYLIKKQKYILLVGIIFVMLLGGNLSLHNQLLSIRGILYLFISFVCGCLISILTVYIILLKKYRKENYEKN